MTKIGKRIIVIGCPGSGKTTFSKKLSAINGYPVFHLDAVWHKPDKTHIERSEFDSALSEIMRRDAWIIDGNYARTIEKRLEICDTAVLFDLPTDVCIKGAEARLGRERADIPWVETELNPTFRAEIENFRERTLPGIYELLEKYKEMVKVIVFKDRKEADRFLYGLKARD